MISPAKFVRIAYQMEDRPSRTRTKFLQVVSLSVSSYALAFVNQMMMAHYFGTSAEMDAYWLAMTMVAMMGFYVQPAREALVPEFYKRLASSREAGEAYFSAAGNFILLVLLAFCACDVAFRDALAGVVSGGGDAARAAAVARLLVFMSPIILLTGITEILNGILIAYHEVIYQYVGRLITLVFSILSLYVLARPAGVLAIVWAAIAAYAALFLVQIAVLRKAGFRYRLLEAPRIDPHFIKMSGALLASFGVSQLYLLAERRIFGGFGAGIVSSFQYGRALSSVPEEILVTSLTVSLWPSILRRTHQGAPAEVYRLTAQVCKYLLLVLAFIVLYTEKFGSGLIYLIYFHGAFGARSLDMTNASLGAIILSLVPLGIGSIMGRGLISSQRAKSMFAIGLTSSTLGVLTLWAGWLRHSLRLCMLHPAVSAWLSFPLTLYLFVRSSGVAVTPSLIFRYASYAIRLGALCLALYLLYPSTALGGAKPGLALRMGLHCLALFAIFAAACFPLKLADWPLPGRPSGQT